MMSMTFEDAPVPPFWEVAAPPPEEARRLKMREILRQVCAEYDKPMAAIIGPRRFRRLVEPRHEFMLRAQEAGYSLTQIGDFLGGRDHTTVLNGTRRAQGRRAQR